LQKYKTGDMVRFSIYQADISLDWIGIVLKKADMPHRRSNCYLVMELKGAQQQHILSPQQMDLVK